MKIYVIGTLSRPETIKEAAMYYLNRGREVMMVCESPNRNKIDLIVECFNKIDSADLVVAVPHEDLSYGEGTEYEVAYAQKMCKTVQKWKGIDEDGCPIL